MPVDGKRRIGLASLQHQIDRAPRRRCIGTVESGFGIDRRETGRQQKRVALAIGHLEKFGQMQQHLAARPRTAGFEKAQMPRRDVGVAGKGKLAEAAALPPLADLLADGLCVHVHETEPMRPHAGKQLPPA